MRSNKGITMLALVITVIILIILTSITVSLIIGQDGLIDKSKDATNEVGIMQIDEEINAMWAKLAIGRSFSSLSLDERAEAFENELKKYDSTATVEVTNYSKKEFTINYKGLEKIFIAERNTTPSTVAEKNGGNGNENPNTDPTQHPDTVTITFVTNGAPEIASQTIAYGGYAEKPTKPRKTMYDFIDWYEESELSTAFNFSKPVTKDTTLYARWYSIVDYYTYSISNGTASITGFSPLGIGRYDAGFSDLEFPTSYNGNPVTSIGSQAFKNRDKLTSVTFNSSITTIGSEAFYKCSKINEIKIPKNVQKLGSYSFEDCTALTSVEVPCDVQYGTCAFRNCSNIENVYIKVGNTTEMRYLNTESSGFSGNSSNNIYGTTWRYAKQGVVVDIENGVTKIGINHFRTSTKVGQIKIPASVTTIDNSAFYGMTQMTKQTRVVTGENILTIPDTVTNMGTYVCNGCSNMEEYEVPKAMIDSKIINEGTYGETKISSLASVPSEIETIGAYAFSSCSSFEEIIIPSTVKTIGSNAFSKCTNTENITINNGVETIGDYVFSKCSKINEIKIPKSVKKIGGYSFENCTALTSVEVPCDVQYGTCAFQSCPNIANVYVKVGNTTEMRELNTSSSGYYGNYSNNIYGTPWYYAAPGVVVDIENGVTKIGINHFYQATKVGNLRIPASVTEIGNYAFYGVSDSLVINYKGTTEQWTAIIKGTNNDKLSTITINYNQ